MKSLTELMTGCTPAHTFSLQVSYIEEAFYRADSLKAVSEERQNIMGLHHWQERYILSSNVLMLARHVLYVDPIEVAIHSRCIQPHAFECRNLSLKMTLRTLGCTTQTAQVYCCGTRSQLLWITTSTT